MGQFSGGDLDHPLAQLGSDASGAESAWDPWLTPPADAVVVTRTSVDEGSCAAFVEATEAMVGAVDAVLITGFWLSACVAATATSCAQRLAGRLHLSGSELVASSSAIRPTGGEASSPMSRLGRVRRVHPREVVTDRRLRGEEFGQAVVLSGRPTTVD